MTGMQRHYEHRELLNPTVDASRWTGRKPRTDFPEFRFELHTRLFAVRVGPFYNSDAYGLSLAWGRVPDIGGLSRLLHRHHWSWTWWTGEQLLGLAE